MTANLIVQESSYDIYEQHQADIEKTLNILGYIPGVSSSTGIGRSLLGIVGLVKNSVKMVFYTLTDIFKRCSHGYGYRTFKHASYIFHDLGNIIRGSIEFLPLIGNNLGMVYDLAIGRFSYSLESKYESQPLFYKVFVKTDCK
jgi:hypothetical protein